MAQQPAETIERGSIYFFYRPRVGEEEPASKRDIQRLYMVLSPDQQERYRLSIIGQKQMPEPTRSGKQRYWGFVDKVRKDPQSIKNALSEETYSTKTRGQRRVPAARPAGEGVYRLARHNGHTHLAYALELPKPHDTGEVQQELNIEREASFIVSVKNPERGAPLFAGLSEDQQASFPHYLQEKFRGRRFSEIDPPQFLDKEGAEFLLIAAAEDVEEELGFALHTEDENASKADIFNDLAVDKQARPVKPLFEGEWD